MTDKEIIKQEIKRRINLLQNGEADLEVMKRVEGVLLAYNSILQFIDSLPEEPASEDLEEAADKYAKEQYPWQNGYEKRELPISDFIAGVEWQKQKMKEVLQTEYEKGRFDMREEMMKALVNGEIVKDIHNQLSVKSEPLNDTFGKFGDKVKIIIIKEE